MSRDHIASAYDRWAGSYDSDVNRTRDLDARLVRDVIGARRFDCIVEAGCGTGKHSAFLAERAGAVIGLDLSAGMLDVARARGLPANVQLVHHDITLPWPLPPATADLVTFNLVLEHVDDLRAVFAHARSACRPGGEVLVSELHPIRQHGGARARFDHAGDTTTIAAFPHHVSDYLDAARDAGLGFSALEERWGAEDPRERPRLLVLRLHRPPAQA